LYDKIKETIGRVFADGKEKHGLRFTRHNGLAKVKTQVLLTFTVMNIKKLAKLLADNPFIFAKTLKIFITNKGYCTLNLNYAS